MNKIAVVIVTYNRKELLQRCLQELEQQLIQQFDILVIDNASTDGTRDIFSVKNERIFYYNTGENLGGAGGFNYGIRKAVESKYEYIWIMDDDTFPTPNALHEFIKMDKKLKGEYGFLTSKVLWKDKSICMMNRQKKTKWKYLKDYTSVQQVQYASFVSLFIPAKTVKKVGLPIKEFFIWADDWEYTRRISKYKRSYFLPQSEVVHWCASNVGADIVNSSKERIDRFRYMYRNDVCLYRLDGIGGYFYLFVRTILHIVRIIMKSQNKLVKLKLMFNSLKQGLSFYPTIEYVDISE